MHAVRDHLVDIDLRRGLTAEQVDNDSALDLWLKVRLFGALAEERRRRKRCWSRHASNRSP